MWKEAVVPQYQAKPVLRHFGVGIHKNHETVRQNSCSPGQDLKPGPSKYVTTHITDRKHFV